MVAHGAAGSRWAVSSCLPPLPTASRITSYLMSMLLEPTVRYGAAVLLRPHGAIGITDRSLTFSKQPNGQVRIVYAGWDDNKVVLEGQVFEVPLGVEGSA